MALLPKVPPVHPRLAQASRGNAGVHPATIHPSLTNEAPPMPRMSHRPLQFLRPNRNPPSPKASARMRLLGESNRKSPAPPKPENVQAALGADAGAGAEAGADRPLRREPRGNRRRVREKKPRLALTVKPGLPKVEVKAKGHASLAVAAVAVAQDEVAKGAVPAVKTERPKPGSAKNRSARAASSVANVDRVESVPNAGRAVVNNGAPGVNAPLTESALAAVRENRSGFTMKRNRKRRWKRSSAG